MGETPKPPAQPLHDGGSAPKPPAQPLLALAALILGAASCERGGAPYDCSCSYLTDFDDAAVQPTRVCAPTPERAPTIARGCAQTAAPAPIQGCTCTPARGAAPCEGAACLPAP